MIRPFAIITLAGCIVTWGIGVLCAVDFALASAVPGHPERASAYGCTVTLPNTSDDDTPLIVRTTHPLSACDESAPVAWGASVRDGAGGRR